MNKRLEGQPLAVSKAMKLRADYLYCIMQEMDEMGIPGVDELLKRAIYKVGAAWAKNLGPVHSPREFHDALFNEDARQIMDLKVKTEGERQIELHFGSCPLVERWKELKLNPVTIRRLCDIARQVDFGNVESFGLKLQMKARLGKGDKKCVLVISSQGRSTK